MRIRNHQSKMLIGGLAAWYCAAALTQGTGNSGGAQNAQGAQSTTPTSQSNPTPASTPTPAPASQPNPTPASNSTPTPASPSATQQRNDQAQFPSSAQRDNSQDVGGEERPQLSRCAALTGIPKAECERRDAPDGTQNLPAGVTPAQADRQRQREAAAARDSTPRSNAADTMRSPPSSTAAPATTAPAASAPAPSSTTRENADTLDRPRK